MEMQLFDEYEKFVQSCDIEHKQLILMEDINSDYAKTPLMCILEPCSPYPPFIS